MPIDASLLVALGSMALSAGALYRARKADKPALSKAMCPCGHAINFHEKLSGRCRQVIRRPITWSDPNRNYPIAWAAPIPCDCQVYAGPELIRGTTGLDVVPLPEVTDT